MERIKIIFGRISEEKVVEESIRIENYIDIDVLQNMLINLSSATGIAFVLVDIKGKPVNEYVGFTEFCEGLRDVAQYKETCYQCDAHGGLHAMIKGKPHIYRCHANLVDFAIPIMLNGNYLGAILGGQTKAAGDVPEDMNNILTSDVGDFILANKAIRDKYDKVPRVPFEKIEAVANTIFEISNYIIEREYVNSVKKKLHDNQLRLMQAEQNKIELEKALKDIELKALYYQINPHFLFNALNTICRMAYLENAEETEEIAFAFSDMMRYVIRENSTEMISVKDELAHCHNYLKIQKNRLQNRLNYTIDMEGNHEGIMCPFMILQPLVENSVKYAAEARNQGATIHIRGYREEKQFIIEIEDDGPGISKEKIQQLLQPTEEHRQKTDSIGISNINQRLLYAYGENYGLEFKDQDQDHMGTCVKIRLKLS